MGVYSDSIKDQPVQSVDIDTVWNTIDDIKKKREALLKQKQDFNLAVNTADIAARTAGIGSVSGNYSTGQVNLTPGSIPLPPDKAIKQRELELMDQFFRSQGMGSQPAGGVSSGGVSPSSPSSAQPQAGVPQAQGRGGLPPSVKSANLGPFQMDFDTPNDVINRADKLRTEVINNPSVKIFNEARPLVMGADEAMSRIKSGDIQNYNAADQLLIIGLQKLLDPSTVKEGEYARTPEGTALINRMSGRLQQLVRGGSGLTLSDREEILKGMKILMDARGEVFNQVIDQYDSLSDRSGVPRDLVTRGYEKHSKTAPGKSSNRVKITSIKEIK